MDTQNYFNIAAMKVFSDLYECIKDDENKTKPLIKSKEIDTKGMTIPIIIGLTDKELSEVCVVNSNNEYNKDLLINIINKYNNDLSTKLETMSICKIERPKTKDSYKKIIIPLINAIDTKKTYCTEKLKRYCNLNKDISNIIIDTSLKRLIICIFKKTG